MCESLTTPQPNAIAAVALEKEKKIDGESVAADPLAMAEAPVVEAQREEEDPELYSLDNFTV